MGYIRDNKKVESNIWNKEAFLLFVGLKDGDRR